MDKEGILCFVFNTLLFLVMFVLCLTMILLCFDSCIVRVLMGIIALLAVGFLEERVLSKYVNGMVKGLIEKKK
ncbi:MAG: hypothetical protein IJL03_00925 [Lachnospiraceae bacterium]|nr:hypothetical protein [Lachnospiraceae bacterium]